jgi:5-hydroxyisourate hydrolase
MEKNDSLSGRITVHVLDTVRGCGGMGVGLVLFRVDGDMRKVLARTQTNKDGRTDLPLLDGSDIHTGIYEVTFDIGAWQGATSDFYDIIPIRFRVTDVKAHYHIPLLLSPFGYTTYRGT